MSTLPGVVALMIAALVLLGPASARGGSPPEPRALLAGEWSWSGGQSTGRLRIEKVGPDGNFKGRLLNARGADVGPVSGRVSGSSVVFVWKGPSRKGLDQEWTFELGTSRGKPVLEGTVREIKSGNSGPVTAMKVAAPGKPSATPAPPNVIARPSMTTQAATSPSRPSPPPVPRRADGPPLSEAEVLALPDSIRRERAAEKALGQDALSGGPPASPLVIASHSPPSRASSFGDLATLADRNYLAAATMAKESYRTMLGALDAGRLKRFNAKWAPVLQNPSAQMRRYLNGINPPLAEFQVLRGQIATGVEEFDDRMQEARMAAAFGNENAVRSLLSQARVVRQQLLADQARMAEVTRQTQAMGDPPDPIPARARARATHQEAVKHLKEIVGEKPGGCWVLTKISSMEQSTDKGGESSLRWTTYRGQPEVRSNTRWEWTEPPDRLYPPPEDAWADWIQTWDSKPRTPPCALDRRDRLKAHLAPLVEKYPGAVVSMRVRAETIDPRTDVGNPVAVLYLGRSAKVTVGENTGDCIIPEQGRTQDETWVLPVPPPTWSRSDKSFAILLTGLTRHLVSYRYTWDPTGESVKPLTSRPAKKGLLPEPRPGPKKDPPVPGKEKDESVVDTSVGQQIQAYQESIALWEKDIAAYRKQLDAAKTEKDRQYLQWIIMGREANLQQERDRIATLQTGQFTHTPTGWEAFCQERAAEQSLKESQRRESFRRLLFGAEKLIAQLPEGEQWSARDEMQKEMMRVAPSGDPAEARKIAEKVLKRSREVNQREGKKWQQRGDQAESFEDTAAGVKSLCDTSLQVLSMGGGRPVLYAYKAATGYVEGGVEKAVTDTARTYSDAVDYSFTALEGYQEGGATGAGEAIATAWIQGKVMEKASGKLFDSLGGGAAPTTKPRVKDQFEAAKFKQEVEWGKAQVKQFSEAQETLMAAGRSGADSATISRLQAEARGLAIKINSSPMAKNVIKYQGDGQAQRAFDTHIRTVYAKVDAVAEQAMRQGKWNTDELVVRDFRNQSSLGTPNMDRDVGLDSAATAARQGGSSPRITQGGERRSVLEWQREMTRSYHDAYRKETGYTADSAWQAVTSSANNEAFKDVAVLTGDMSKANRAWIGQTADVITYKTTIPASEMSNASFSHWLKVQESARGFGKELNKKVLPVVNAARPTAAPGTDAYRKQAQRLKETVGYLKDLNALCDAFGQGKMDPLEFRDRFAEITGGKTVTQVASEVGTLLEATVKFDAAKGKK